MAKRTEPAFAVGVDYGTNSVRALIVDVADGREIATAVYNYPSGEAGILLDPKDPHLARQNPATISKVSIASVGEAVAAGRVAIRPFGPERVVGIGVDTTGSTPLPVDRHGHAAGACSRSFADESGGPRLAVEGPHRIAEAAEITEKAKKRAATSYLSQVRRRLQQRVVLVEDPALQADGAEGLRGGLFLGRAGRLRAGIRHRQPRSRYAPARHLRGRTQGHVQRAVGRPAQQASSSPSSIPTWPRSRERYATPAL